VVPKNSVPKPRAKSKKPKMIDPRNDLNAWRPYQTGTSPSDSAKRLGVLTSLADVMDHKTNLSIKPADLDIVNHVPVSPGALSKEFV